MIPVERVGLAENNAARVLMKAWLASLSSGAGTSAADRKWAFDLNDADSYLRLGYESGVQGFSHDRDIEPLILVRVEPNAKEISMVVVASGCTAGKHCRECPLCAQ